MSSTKVRSRYLQQYGADMRYDGGSGAMTRTHDPWVLHSEPDAEYKDTAWHACVSMKQTAFSGPKAG